MESLEQIKQNILDWTSTYISEQFTFRKYQLESIMFLIKSIISDNRETTIIEAPTGSGKSFISLITAGVLDTYYGKKSYILCSDLFLWEQYREAIDKYNIKSFGYLKGSQGNYKCIQNGYDFKFGRCQLEKVSYHQLKDMKFIQNNMYTCVYKCDYMQQRFRAERSNVTLMTYQLWLHHMNLVKSEKPSFPQRDVIFCDECHNIPNIVQQFCTPVINPLYDINMIGQILKYAEEHSINASDIDIPEIKLSEDIMGKFDDTYVSKYHSGKVLNYINELYREFHNNYEKSSEAYRILEKYQNILKLLGELSENITDNIKSYSTYNGGKITKAQQNINGKAQWCLNYISSVDNFITAVKSAGIDYIIVEYNKDDKTGEYSYQLNCAKEDYMCSEYLLKHAGNKVMLSATVGGHSSFDENMGIEFTRDKVSYMCKIPSTFNFDKSPIYYIPTYKMNYANKNNDFPNIIQLVNRVVSAHKSSRGIIHTGSYENAVQVLANAPYEIKNRLIIYSSSKDKNEAIAKLKSSADGILIGPTLTEGVDLPDDMCRFIIIIKMPYPNIKSQLVKKKIELFPSWYNSTTSNIIIQSIGRGVRNENDYCTTYIMDGCFTHLYEQTKEQYPDYIQKRIKYIYN